MIREQIELSYLAGFFDGEGCISVSPVRYPGGSNFQICVRVAQNDGRALEPFAERWGGKISQQTRGSDDSTSQWGVGGQRALGCIRDLLPYLRGKKEEAVAALGWPSVQLRGRGHITESSVIEKRRAIYEQLRLIKEARKVAIASETQPGIIRMRAEPQLLDRPIVIDAMRLYKSGLTCERVAAKIGVTPSSISHWARMAGVVRKRGPQAQSLRREREALGA